MRDTQKMGEWDGGREYEGCQEERKWNTMGKERWEKLVPSIDHCWFSADLG